MRRTDVTARLYAQSRAAGNVLQLLTERIDGGGRRIGGCSRSVVNVTQVPCRRLSDAVAERVSRCRRGRPCCGPVPVGNPGS